MAPMFTLEDLLDRLDAARGRTLVAVSYTHLDVYKRQGQQGMTCNQCHNPHTAQLKVGHSQELCNSCHNTEGHYYTCLLYTSRCV